MTAPRKLPSLRPDIKISRQVQSEKVNYVVKDPLKNEYYRFDESEWRIIELFDGKKTADEAVKDFNLRFTEDPIDVSVLKDFESSLGGMHLLEKSKQEMNVMLIEKMKETRKSMLLSKEGSLMYKRFPLVDPDRFFDRVIPKIGFFWTRGFFLISFFTMILAVGLVGIRLDEFQNGVFEVFAFSKLSWWNIAFLWITIYAIIAIHELGHGLTCKRYGGEVHEIGFLLLFFQPCLYANVNDAWLFDKKWKQVLVTIAGGYIEFFVGALFAIVWFLSNPNTLINVLSLQVMTICSVSTVIFNFNPLIKLDGYYLLADFLETPNLRDGSFDYLKYVVKRYVFRTTSEESETTSREKVIFLLYGVGAFFWVASSTLGLFYMAKGFLIERFHHLGVLISLWVAYKLFGGHLKKTGMFLVQLWMGKRAFFKTPRGKAVLGGVAAVLLVFVFFPVSYPVRGKCSLEAAATLIVRAPASGVVASFSTADGAAVKDGQSLFRIESSSLGTDYEMAGISVAKLEYEERAAMNKEDTGRLLGVRQEIVAKKENLEKIKAKVENLEAKAEGVERPAVVNCPDQTRKVHSYVQEGDELCRIHVIDELKAVIEVPEQEVRFIAMGDEVQFKLQSKPLQTYRGRVQRIRDVGQHDPLNPKARLYHAEIVVMNPGELRPGMTGLAKIVTESIPAGQFIGRRLASFFRLDLFF